MVSWGFLFPAPHEDAGEEWPLASESFSRETQLSSHSLAENKEVGELLTFLLFLPSRFWRTAGGLLRASSRGKWIQKSYQKTSKAYLARLISESHELRHAAAEYLDSPPDTYVLYLAKTREALCIN